LNYWLLRRRGRLHLLLFTVPAAALLISGSLFGYVLVADGLESRLRSRSYMELDQRNHEAAIAARLSYYTGLSPSNGLHFSTDTLLVPFEKVAEINGWSQHTRTVNWIAEEGEQPAKQHLQRGWLTSRMPTQYVSLRTCPTTSELRVIQD